MGHDEHFLQRLDRMDREQVELALGLYRDHELVRYILEHTHLPEGTERVALALDDTGAGPHLVVARTGAFVTCLGKGMSTGGLRIVSRAHLDALASKMERVREGIALAKKRGFDEARLLKRVESSGPGVAREDFLGACAMLGPAVTLLTDVYVEWAGAVEEIFPLLLSTRVDAPMTRRARSELARGAWAMAHMATILAESAPRDWVREWTAQPTHAKASPWELLTIFGSFSFVARAAWVAARLGKPVLATYKSRFASGSDPMAMREAGWGLLCLALRHAPLRNEALRALEPASLPTGRTEPWVDQTFAMFAAAADNVRRREDELRQEGLTLGRDLMLVRTSQLPEDSPYRFTGRDQVPDDLVLPALFDASYDANNGERGADLMLIGIAAFAKARAEDLYFPAQVLHAIGPMDLEGAGESLVEIRRALHGVQRTVRRADRHGRNDPCPCGSGKKYKKCHGR
jgi:hypothetical protein